MTVTLEALQIQFQAQGRAEAIAFGDALLRAAAGAEGLGKETDQTDQRIRRTGQTYAAVARQIDGATAATAGIERATKTLNARQREIVAEYERSAKSAADLAKAQESLARVAQLYDREVERHIARGKQVDDGFKKQSDSTNTLTKSTGGATQAVRQLGIQSIDVFQQLASGAPVMATMIQQGGQIAQVAAQGGVSLGALARGAIGAITAINPFALIGAVATAGIVGFGLAAETSGRHLSALQNQLRATRSDYEGLAIQVTATARSVAATSGIGIDDARSAAATIAGASRFAGGKEALEDLVKTAGDLAIVMGKTLPEAAKDMATAIDDPAAAAKKLADQALPGMSQALAYSIKLQADAGDKAGAYARQLDVVRAATKGAQDNLTPLGSAFRELTQALSGAGETSRSMADTLGGFFTNVAAGYISYLTKLVEAAKWAKGQISGLMDAAVATNTGVAPNGAKVTTNGDYVGLFQVGTAAARDVGMDPALRFNYQQNITAATTYFRQLLDRSGGNIDFATRAYNQGFNGAAAGGGAGYLASVAGQDLAQLPDKVFADIAQAVSNVFADYARQGDVSAITDRLGRVALQESGGQHFANTNYRDPNTAAARIGPSFRAVESDSNIALGQYLTGIRNDAFNAALSAGGLAIDRQRNAAAQQNILSALPFETDPEALKVLTAGLEELRKQEAGLITEQEKLARTSEDATKALSAQAGFSRTMAEIEVKYAIAARDSGKAIDQQALAREKAAKKVDLATQYEDVIQGATLEAAAIQRVSAAYDGSVESVSRAQNYEKAYALAREKYEEGQDSFTDAVKRYSAALDDSSTAARTLQHAQSSVGALFDTLGNAADRLGQSLVDAFVTGQGAAVSFWNIVKGAGTSVLSDLLKQAAINPLRNWLSGTTSAPSLWTAVSTLSGGGSGTGGSGSSGALGMLGQAGNISTGAGITDALGLTNLKGILSGFGDKLGLTGDGGLLSSVSGWLGAPLPWANATNAALAALPNGMAGPATLSQFTSAGGATIGQFLGGAGLGFGAGSLAGGFIQNSLGKVGPAPTIGAGGGALAGAAIGSFIPVIGTILGGLAGGILGGAGGGLIGPKAPNAYSSTGIDLAGGQLSLGATVSQLVDTTQEVAAAAQQVAQINAFLAQNGLRVSSLGNFGQIGQNTPGETPDPTKYADVASAFGQMRFTSDDATKAAALADKSFASITDLATALQGVADNAARVTDMLDNVIPALTATADTGGSIAQQMKALAEPYNQAFAQIQDLMRQGQPADVMVRLMQGAQDIITALDGAYQKGWAAINEQLALSDRAMDVRLAQAKAAVSGDPAAIQGASLMAFDLQADQQRKARSDELIAMFGDAYRFTADYANRIAMVDQALAAERLGITQRYADQQLAQDKAAAEQQAALAAQAAQAERDLMASIYALWSRQATAEAAVSGDPLRIQAAALQAFDERARLEREAQDQKMVATYGEAIRQSQVYADMMGQLDRTTYAERYALQKQYSDQALAQDKAAADALARQRQSATQSALGIITSLADFSRSISYGDASPLSPTAQYEQARREFESIAAAARMGDTSAMAQLPGLGGTLLSTSRTVNGSGIVYATDWGVVQDTIRGSVSQPLEAIIANAMADLQAAQEDGTAVLAEKLTQMVDLTQRMLTELAQANRKPRS